ncbi:hypothetical protein DOTSEDRAFT_75856 [Dothistroma septosporum NZE10]|uniref:C2H2 type master regulator of conidiophore development brlA n=1 Tax=Dothistroma septosporum (strain NZE10 / CBS 128990) TaxID=675120 RepID=N1PDE3_DOTSN|nr:hypothetical protein DOTSEDRAFT_75856 [Dothistroma septosporum NZE10]
MAHETTQDGFETYDKHDGDNSDMARCIDPRLRDHGAIDMSGTWTDEAGYIASMRDLELDITNGQLLGGYQTTWQQDSIRSAPQSPLDFEDTVYTEVHNSQPLWPTELMQHHETPYHANAIASTSPTNQPYTPPSSNSARTARHRSDGMVATVFGAQQHATLPQLRLVTSEPQTFAPRITQPIPGDGCPTPTSTRSAQTSIESPLYTNTPSRPPRAGLSVGVSMSLLTFDAFVHHQEQEQHPVSAVSVQHWRDDIRSKTNQGQTLQPPPLHHQTQSAPASIVQSQTSYTCDVCGSTFGRNADLQHHRRNHGDRVHGCGACDASFVFRKDLRRHAGSVHQEQASFFCEYEDCKHRAQGFKRKDHWKRHMKGVHNWAFPPSRHTSNASRSSRHNA